MPLLPAAGHALDGLVPAPQPPFRLPTAPLCLCAVLQLGVLITRRYTLMELQLAACFDAADAAGATDEEQATDERVRRAPTDAGVSADSSCSSPSACPLCVLVPFLMPD